MTKLIAAIGAGVLAVASTTAGQTAGQTTASQTTAKPVTDNYDLVVQQYLAQARAMAGASVGPGSLWMAGLASDLRARRVNDLVTIRVVENVTGAGTADSSLDKKGGASIGVTTLFGLETLLPGSINPASLAGINTSTNFNGGGTTARTGALSGVMTARVAEVLPNGDLVVEGVREIEINGDRQVLVLNGVVRPIDISTNNVVPSTAVGQMRIRYYGRGLMKDNLSPGWLIRVLNMIF